MTMIASCFSKAENSLEGTTENDETLDFIYKYMLKENRFILVRDKNDN